MHHVRISINSCRILELSLFVILLILSVPAAEGAGKHKTLIEGNYNGTLSVHSVSGQKERIQETIRADVKKTNDGLSITLKDFKDESVLFDPITALKWKNCGIISPVSFQFQFAMISAESFELKQVSHKKFTCFVGNRGGDIEFCMDDENFTIEFYGKNESRISITGTRFDIQPHLENEEPREFTVSEAIEIALKNNSDLKIAWENMVQSKLMSKRAKLNLIPRMSYGPLASIGLAILFYDPSVILEVASSVVPFLIPTKIIDVRIQKWQYKAKQMAYALLRANKAVSVEQLAINYVMQRELREALKKLQSEGENVFQTILELEINSQIEKGSTDRMQVSLDNLHEAILDNQHRIHDISSGFSKLLGFNNPEVVKNIILDENITSIDSVSLLNESEEFEQKEEYAKFAIQNSLEIRQQHYLERAEKDEKIKLFLSWFSPETDNLFGFNFIAEYEIKKSEIRAIRLMTDKIRQSLKSHAYEQVRERNEWRKEYDRIYKSLKLRQKLWSEFRQSLASDGKEAEAHVMSKRGSVDIDKAREYLEDVQTELVSYFNMRGIVSVAQAELDRLALRGPYRKLLPRLEKDLGIENEIFHDLYQEKLLAIEGTSQKDIFSPPVKILLNYSPSLSLTSLLYIPINMKEGAQSPTKFAQCALRLSTAIPKEVAIEANARFKKKREGTFAV